jgi:hypothetical protein
MRCRHQIAGGLVTLLLVVASQAQDASPAQTYGWRGNWTGLYPDSKAPGEWGRIAKGILCGMTCQAAKPANGAAPSGQPVERGLIRDWLVIGPLPIDDSAKFLAVEQIPGEAKLAPQEGDKVADLAWQRLQVPKKADYEVWGTTELAWVDLGDTLGFKPNMVGYAFTNIHAQLSAGDGLRRIAQLQSHRCGGQPYADRQARRGAGQPGLVPDVRGRSDFQASGDEPDRDDAPPRLARSASGDDRQRPAGGGRGSNLHPWRAVPVLHRGEVDHVAA